MAEFIRLAEMPKGKAFKTLSQYEKMYIDENWQYEPMQSIANTLKIRWIDVDIYYSRMGYEPVKTWKKKPKQIAKSEIFDIENYNPFSI